MKVKTSLTLSEEILRAVRRAGVRGESRSQTIERLVTEGLAARVRRESSARDLMLINTHADVLNAEAIDVLGYQDE